MQRQLPSNHSARRPVAEFLSIVGALIALGVAFLLGIFFVAIVAGLILLGAAVVTVRVWWLRRQFRQAVAGHAPADAKTAVIEGEYTIVDADRSGHAGAPEGRDR